MNNDSISIATISPSLLALVLQLPPGARIEAMKLRRIKARAYRQKPKRDPWAEWSEWSRRQIIRIRLAKKHNLVPIDTPETWNLEPLRSLDWWRANSPDSWRMDPKHLDSIVHERGACVVVPDQPNMLWNGNPSI